MHSNSAETVADIRLATLEIAFDQEKVRSDARLSAAERRIRVTWTLAGVAVLTAFVFGANKESVAQGYGTTLAQVLNRVIALESKTASISAITDENTGKPTVRFDGVNVQVVNGTGQTQSAPNGVGNLIIGYNELRNAASDNRTGSHNLVVGSKNNYSSFGGMVVGNTNTISGNFASVSGGGNNTASGTFSCVSGGAANTASGFGASVSGGEEGVASNLFATISGGSGNTAGSFFSTVSGGFGNSAFGAASTVSGGQNRLLLGDNGWQGGGLVQAF